MKHISIIMLSCNNPYIDISIDSVYEHIDTDDEIIVVDDHSDKDIINILNEYKVAGKIRLLYSSKRGNRSHNRNLGASKAKNEILFFMDGDIVMCDDAIYDLRRAHEQREEIAFIGPKYCIHYSDIHFKLFSNINNYIDLLKTPYGRKQLIENPLFTDERSSFWNNENYRQFFWLNYYTGASSVTKEVFEKTGGFDESFQLWGSEDVDLGYRIKNFGQIGFLPRLIALHIPHPRNIISIETSNFENMLIMLKKYCSWEFEITHSFSSRPDVIVSINNMINQMRMISINEIKLNPHKSTLFVDVVSKQNPYGKLIYYDSDNVKNEIQSLGVTTTFNNKEFKCAYISDAVFIYPPVITSRIFQEIIRVSEEVFLLPSNNDIRVDWSDKVFIAPYHSNSRIKYNSDDLMDYIFCEDNGIFKITSEIKNI